MAALNFPEALADGQTFEADTGVVYVYQGNPPTGFWSATSTKDGQQNQDARYVQVAGDKMTGNLLIGGTGANSDFITLTAQNGNAEFKGEVTLTNGQINTRLSDGRLTVGGYNNEASTAIYKGNISIAKDADTCLDIYGGYNLSIPNISLRADGTGNFSKNINVSGSARIGGLQAASAATTGVDVLSTGVVYATASNGPVFVGQTQGTNVSTSQIDADGSADFAKAVTTSEQFYGQSAILDTTAGGFAVFQGKLNGAINSEILASGAATFAGGATTISGGGDFSTNGRISGYRIDLKSGFGGSPATALAVYFDVDATDERISLTADGKAVFRNQVTAIAHNADGELSALKAVQTNSNGYALWVGYGETGAERTAYILPNGTIVAKAEPWAGSNVGVKMDPTGSIICTANNSNVFWGFTQGNVDPTSYITDDGAALFKSDVSAIGFSAGGGAGPSGYLFTGYESSSLSGNTTVTIDRNGIAKFGDRAATGDWTISPTQGIRYNNGSEELTILGTGGSAAFAGGISLLSTTNNGMQINSEGEITVQRSSGSSILFRGYDSTTNSLNIFANGACELAGNTCFVTSAGSILLNNSGNASGSARTTLNSNGNASFAGSVQVGGDPDNGANLGTKALPTGAFLATNSGTNPVWASYKQGSGASTTSILADGTAEFCKFSGRGIFLDPGGTFTPTIRLNASSVSNPGGGSKAIIFQYDGSETGFIRYNGNAVFNLESDDPNQYTTTTDADGNEITVYNGPTLDVKDRLVKTKAALEAIKTAAQDTNTDLAGLKSAIVTALSDI